MNNTTLALSENYDTTLTSDNISALNSTISENLDALFQFVTIFVPVVWGILTVVGVLGNTLVIYTLIRNGDRNATNYFLINLAISDFTFLAIVVPFTATLFVFPSWVFGNGMCKIVMYMTYVTLHATCLTLMALTLDRYFAIVYAVKSRKWRTSRIAAVACLTVWSVSFMISLPFAIYFRTVAVGEFEYCQDEWPEPQALYGRISIIAVVLLTFVLPLSVIIYSYTMILRTLRKNEMEFRFQFNRSCVLTTTQVNLQERRQKRVTKLVASIVIVFALFWLPIHTVNLWIKLDEDFPYTPTMFMIKIVSHTLSYANSCVNPFVYAFLGDGFRKALRKTFPCIPKK